MGIADDLDGVARDVRAVASRLSGTGTTANADIGDPDIPRDPYRPLLHWLMGVVTGNVAIIAGSLAGLGTDSPTTMLGGVIAWTTVGLFFGLIGLLLMQGLKQGYGFAIAEVRVAAMNSQAPPTPAQLHRALFDAANAYRRGPISRLVVWTTAGLVILAAVPVFVLGVEGGARLACGNATFCSPIDSVWSAFAALWTIFAQSLT